ncbi:MAG: hypothetical protein JW806_03695 [Sedimentisphaerales bacterium]|nr:hypothetical protein [Sedimentisphaerales bacterium]
MRKSLFILVLTAIFITTPGLNEAALFIPQDQDKDGMHNPDHSCWLASASNMLAAAGYADGNVQTIYDRMTSFFGWEEPGLQKLALDWYIDQYPEPANAYTVVEEHWGNDQANPDFISQRLAADQLVSIMFWYGQEIGHSLTIWDNQSAVIPQGYFSDSDKDNGSDFTWYTWIDDGTGDWKLDYPGVTDADVNYVVTLGIPEPATICMLTASSLIIVRKRNKDKKRLVHSQGAGRKR